MMDKHDILYKVVSHFLHAETPLAYDCGHGRCVYRGDDDPQSPVRCAMGAIIPDDRYVPMMEGALAGDLLLGRITGDEEEESHSLRDLFTAEVSEGWLNELQRCHDDVSVYRDSSPEVNRARILFNLGKFAAKHGLHIDLT